MIIMAVQKVLADVVVVPVALAVAPEDVVVVVVVASVVLD